MVRRPSGGLRMRWDGRERDKSWCLDVVGVLFLVHREGGEGRRREGKEGKGHTHPWESHLSHL